MVYYQGKMQLIINKIQQFKIKFKINIPTVLLISNLKIKVFKNRIYKKTIQSKIIEANQKIRNKKKIKNKDLLQN